MKKEKTESAEIKTSGEDSLQRLVSHQDIFGEHGLKGDSGLMPPETGIFHISANYDCNAMVFVKRYSEDIEDYFWQRMPKEEAEKQGLEIISCSKCDKHAISLDHLWPYHDERNYCEEHKPKRSGVQNMTFRVYGIPRPGGSKRAFFNQKTQRIMVTDASKYNKTWRDDVKNAFVENKSNDYSFPDTAISLKVVFYMPRPKNHYKTDKNKGVLKDNAPYYHTNKPDCTKLLRSTEDALTGLAWKDDSQISIQTAVKIYGASPGAIITIANIKL